MNRLFQDTRFALRVLLARRGFSTVAIITLALGIGITTAIFSIVYSILLRPLPYPDADRIVAVWETRRTDPQPRGSMSHPNYLDVKAKVGSLESIALATTGNATITGLGATASVPTASVTPGLFDVFGVNLVLGRDFTEDEDRPNGPKAVILSHEYWRTKFGARGDAVGSTLQVNGAPHRIVGVAPPSFDYPGNSELWIPAQNDDQSCGRSCVYMSAVGRLRAGATVEQAGTELATLAQQLEQLYPKANTDRMLGVTTLQHSITGDVQKALYILLAAVGMVLLIACANVANLLLVRGAGRRAELAVRSVLGAGRRRLVTQLMTENLLLAIIAGGLGVVLAIWIVAGLRSLAPASLPRADELGLDGATVIFAIALAAVTALLFGLAPALQLSRISLAESIRGAGRGTGGGSQRQFGRSAILVAEVALSIMLLLGAGLLLRSFGRLTNVDPHFDPENRYTFTITLPDAAYPTPERATGAILSMRDAFRAIPGVENVALGLGLPFSDIRFVSSFRRLDKPEPAPGEGPVAEFDVIDENYLRTMNIALLRGRDFSAQDRYGAPAAVLINQQLANEYYPGEDPIGKTVYVGVGLGFPHKEPRTIVGIVDDVPQTDLQQPASATIYTSQAQVGASFMSFVVQTRMTEQQTLSAVRRQLAAIDPDLPLELTSSMTALVDTQLAAPRFYLALISLFAALAAVLAGIGIYGVVAYLVAHRKHEIGVRMALGARAPTVVQLVVWQGLKPALIGVAIGIAGALATARVIASLLFETPPNDAVTFVGVTALLISIVLVACAVPAWRATRVAPASALRAD
ncbi:MAG TPA: ABC transporter permease [Longimicrobiales bacterium]